MRLTTIDADRARFPDREYFRCDACRLTAYKDSKGTHWISDRDLGPLKPIAGPITAPIDPALARRDSGWRRKHRWPKDA